MCKNVCVDDDAAVVGATHVITINKTKMNKQTVAFICFIHQKEGKKVKLDIFFHQFNMFLEASLNFVEVKSILKKKNHCPE